MLYSLFTWLVWLALIVAAVRVANALFLREIKLAGVSWRRAEAPGDYWFAVGSQAWLAFGAALVLLLVRIPGRLAPAFLVVTFAQGLADMVWRGGVPTWSGFVRREDSPWRYWTEAALYAAFIAFGIVYLIFL
jgi:hypothetical protein